MAAIFFLGEQTGGVESNVNPFIAAIKWATVFSAHLVDQPKTVANMRVAVKALTLDSSPPACSWREAGSHLAAVSPCLYSITQPSTK